MRRSSNRVPPGGAAGALLASLLALLVSAAAVPGAARAAPEETWYILELGGRPAGWVMESRRRDGDRVITEERMTIRLARGESALEVSLAGRFEERADGEPISLWTRQQLGSEPVETTYVFLDGGESGIEALSVQGGRERRERLPAPEGDWLTPAAARRVVAAHHAAGERRYTFRAIEPPEGPEPVTTTRTRIGEGDSEGGEETGAGSRWREETSSAPGAPSIVELDDDGDVIRSSTEIFGLEAVAYRSDRETALAAGSSSAGEAGPEVMVRTLVHPDREIPGHRSAPRAVYELSLEDGSPMPALPDGGAQRVVPEGSRGERLRVTIYRDPDEAPPPAPAPPPRPPDADPLPTAAGPDTDAVTPAHLASSLYLDHRDPEVRRLLTMLRPSDADPPTGPTSPAGVAETARRLARFVHRYVGRKDLDTGFATASEVARTRRGDCTEHAVLLAALLRAEGIPSRVVTGLVYLDEMAGAEAIFGYHMWVQAALPAVPVVPSDGVVPATHWVDLDPTLPWGFDATHIAIGHSDLSGSGRDPSLDRLVSLIGKLRIAVIEVADTDEATR